MNLIVRFVLISFGLPHYLFMSLVSQAHSTTFSLELNMCHLFWFVVPPISKWWSRWLCSLWFCKAASCYLNSFVIVCLITSVSDWPWLYFDFSFLLALDSVSVFPIWSWWGSVSNVDKRWRQDSAKRVYSLNSQTSSVRFPLLSACVRSLWWEEKRESLTPSPPAFAIPLPRSHPPFSLLHIMIHSSPSCCICEKKHGEWDKNA
jgi:hypothetical protein